ncbi:GDSL-type esterase/lipase family protein [Streptomyces meridianus]|uniref:GDSL-type esterase/lipase family protein n=1 Tax=Streptomyces meridianus TaxID=2938945 RepID=A0ABT0X4W2_9ACTN|nr:GDSL-type esterase/lipase family protein [Streptomyces meridianus]MCM2577573.1 GDSL-type esterase/lipase family protein [Streptomyces meridianus]
MVGSTRVFFIGDSFVQGIGDPGQRGWVGRVLQASHAPGRDLTGFNLGVRRNTSDDVLARCWDEVSRRTDPAADHRLVVSFGINDAVEECGAVRVRHERTVSNLAELLAGASRRGMAALVVGPPPVIAGGRSHLDRLLALADGFDRVCAQAETPYIPVTQLLAADDTWQAEAGAGDAPTPGPPGTTGWRRWC